MYSGLKKLSAISLVLSVINGIGALITIMFLAPMAEIDMTTKLALGTVLITGCLTTLLIGIALWSLHDDLNAFTEVTLDDIRKLKKDR